MNVYTNPIAAQILPVAHTVQRDTLRAALRVLTVGASIRDGGLSLDDDALFLVLRELRTQLAERDLYELLYGPLPACAVDPDSRLDPFTEVTPDA